MLVFMKTLTGWVKTLWFDYKANQFLKGRNSTITYNHMKIDPTVPLNELSTEDLQELLTNHDCHLSPDSSCKCEEILEILHRRSLEQDLESGKFKIKPPSDPF